MTFSHGRFLLFLFISGLLTMPTLAGNGNGWGYDQAGLGCWGGTCANGWKQSPIDIRDDLAVEGKSPKLEFNYKSTEYITYDSGYNITYKANGDAGTLKIGDKQYKLLQFHFHTASEHTHNGIVFPMEVHLVHQEVGGEALAVVGVFFHLGESSDFMNPILDALPSTLDRKKGNVSMDAATFLPSSKVNYRYSGSLTTPPCSEVVSWHVMKMPQNISADQIKRFTDVVPRSARPTQPLNRRELTINPE